MTNETLQIVVIIAVCVMMYFMLIRPQKKQEKEIREMRAALKVGDDIVTIGGICGKIVRIKDNRLTIQVGADKTKFDIEKWAVSRVDDGRKSSVAKASKEEEEEKKVTSKNMKKLGKKEEAPAEAEAAEVAAPVEE